jgi:prophage regulatory protein
MSDKIQNTEHQIIKLPSVINIAGISRTSIYNRIEDGTFPKQISLGERSVGWIKSEILEWIDSRIKERDERVK